MKNLDKETSNKINTYITEFQQRTHSTVLYLTKSGSKLYGTDTENSDLDIKGIFVPSKQSILLKRDLDHYVRDTNNTKVKNSKDDIDFTLISIHKFFSLLSKSETGAVDILFSMWSENAIIFENKQFTDTIKENYRYFLNKDMKSFIGYALGQTKKFGIKGARYAELDVFVNDFRVDFEKGKTNKLLTKFDDLKEYIKIKNFKYIKFTTAKTTRNSNTEGEYLVILGKMFEGTVTIEYFYDRINKLYNQFGNRTISTSKSAEKNKDIIDELKKLREIL